MGALLLILLGPSFHTFFYWQRREKAPTFSPAPILTSAYMFSKSTAQFAREILCYFSFPVVAQIWHATTLAFLMSDMTHEIDTGFTD